MMKRRCRKADYIYVERCQGTRNHLYKEWHEANQKNIVKICQITKEGLTKKQRLLCDRRLLRAIKKLWNSDTVVAGDKQITLEWGMPNELFEIRKQRMLQNIEDMLEIFCVENGEEKTTSISKNIIVKKGSDKEYLAVVRSERRSFLLVLDSKAWTYKEVKLILWKVQQRYEDIYVVLNNSAFSVIEMSNYFLEEFGVVLHILDTNMAVHKRFHTIFFLLEHCDYREKDYLFENKYSIVEWEENQFQSLLFVALDDTINGDVRGEV